MNLKRLAAALMITGASVFAGGAVTHADYPPGAGTATISDATPDAGSTFTVTATACQAGETVTFVFQGVTKAATCSGTTATASFSAPATGGAFTGTASYGTSGGTVSFTVNVPAPGGLPATGSSGSNTTMTIAAVLLAAGVGIFLVSRRRRQLSLGAAA